MSDEERRLGSIKLVALKLDVSERAAWKWLATGRLGPKPIRIGRAVRFDLAELDAWIGERCPHASRWAEIRAEGGAR